MSDELFEAISHLEAWIRDYGAHKNPVFIEHLRTVIEAAKRNEETGAQTATSEAS